MSDSEFEALDAVAVIGMAGRFPRARTLEQFWRNLRDGVECVSLFSLEEMAAEVGMDPAALDHPKLVGARGVLEDPELFDAAFFDVPAMEATLMDPQHRLFLEQAWAALEDAGCDPSRFAGAIGVFGGVSQSSYFLNNLITRPDLLASAGSYQVALGTDKDYLTTRVSYKLDLRGPSVDVQTACSTSLVAIHLACQSLLTYQSDLALAGGSSIKVPQRTGYLYAEGGLDSSDGRCRAFDAKGDGSIYGSGVGVVVLKRLDEALADRDPIDAVVLASAMTNDGARKIGYTAPSVDGQARAIATAQALADVDPATIGYVEAHGTGTALGDPIEVSALTKAYRRATQAIGYCGLGSVKPNIGHLSAAAGVAGFIKAVLTLKNRQMAPVLHFETPNPKIDFASSPFFVNDRLRPLEPVGGASVLRAGVSSFGLGGTNVHAVLQEAPAPMPPSAEARPARPWQLLTVSARSEAALAGNQERLAGFLAGAAEAEDGPPLADVAYTALTGRALFPRRRFLVACDAADAASVLESADPTRLLGSVQEAKDRPASFLFSGLGDHYLGMGQGLYEREPLFRDEIDRCAELLEGHLGLDLRELLYPTLGAPSAEGDKGNGPGLNGSGGIDLRAMVGRAAVSAEAERLNETRILQPATFAVEYALARLLMSWGVTPAAMLGYSLGEYVAATLAGVFTLEDALYVVAERARLIEALPAGSMLVVPLSEEAAFGLLGSELSLAAINAPEVSVLAGPEIAVDDLEERLREAGQACRRLPTRHAFHSRLMEPIAGAVTELLGRVALSTPRIPYLSNVTGDWIRPEEATDPSYYARHLCQPVRFAAGIRRLMEGSSAAMVEVGPGQGLSTLTLQQPRADGQGAPETIATLRHAYDLQDDQAFLLGALGRLWLAGVPIDWSAFFAGEERNRLHLPTYAFDRKRFWVERRSVTAAEDSLPSASGAFPAEKAERSSVAALAAAATPPGAADDLHDRPELATAFVAPATDLETVLAGLWERLLGVGPIGAHDSFFELGGHSLLGTQLMSRIRDLFGVELPLPRLFESPTVAGLSSAIDEARSALASAGEQHRGPAAASTIARRPRAPGAPPPLAFAQERQWFLEQLTPENPAYNIPQAARLVGPLSLEHLASGYSAVLARHEGLRTTFQNVDGRPVGRVAPARREALPLVDLAGLAPTRRQRMTAKLSAAEASRPFDLARGPLCRLCLLRLGIAPGGEPEHRLLLTMHHIVSDGWSLALFTGELVAFYSQAVAGAPLALPEPPIQYADYAAWQREWLAGEERERLLAYWRARLSPPAPVLELPTDRPRPAVQTARGARRPFLLDSEATSALRRLAGKADATLFMALLAAFELLLWRLTGQRDLVVGTPVAGRPRSETEGLVGYFVNTLALRAAVDPAAGFRALTEEVRASALGAFAHQELPFEMLVDAVQPDRALAHSPLFQVLFILHNTPPPALSGDGRLRFEPLPADSGASRFDWTWSLAEAGDQVRGYVEYNRDLFDATTIDRAVRTLEALLRAGASEPDRPLAALAALAPSERHQLLIESNDTRAALEKSSLHGLFLVQAAREPGRPALVFGEEPLSYGELEQASGALARRLVAMGVGPETVVGLAVERSPRMVIAMMAILRAGSAYLPLDPDYPAERLAYILTDSKARVVVTERAVLERVPQLMLTGGARTLLLDRHASADGDLSETRTKARGSDTSRMSGKIEARVDPSRLAYVIYTSGSTGRPKGVQISHGAAVNFLRAMAARPGLTANDALLAVTSLSFDIALLELLLPLTVGARVELASAAEAGDGAALLRRIEGSGVTAMQATPSTWRLLRDAGWRGTPALLALCGGEAMPADLAMQLSADLTPPAGALWNLYGPTETTVWSSVERIDSGGAVLIGRPIANTTMQLLDSEGGSVPSGATGALWIGGAGLARGYLGRPALTADAFRPDPFSRQAGARIYRTGDLARRRPDGRLECLGRVDHQVKLRGHRIELGEIEAVLARHPAIAAVAAAVREVAPGDPRLVAYFEPAAGHAEPSIEELRTFAAEKLPGYMVPSLFVALEALPLTPNRKIDRRALPSLEGARPRLGSEYVAPRTATERALAEIWAGLLGVDRVGALDGFFALGGHSLLATQVISRVRDRLGVELPLAVMFEARTLADLARRVDLLGSDGARTGGPIALPLVRQPPELDSEGRRVAVPSFAQERLWFVDRLLPDSPLYNMPTVLRMEGDLRVAAMQRTLSFVVERHEALRTTLPTGPDGAPLQVVAAPASVPLPTVDLSGLAASLGAELAQTLVSRGARRPFDLARGPLLRALLVRLSERDHVGLFVTHHVVSDGWSLGLLTQELGGAYAAFVAARPPREALPALPVQYPDYATWQRGWLRGEVLEAEIGYWRQTLAGAPPVLALPLDRPRPAIASEEGDTFAASLPTEIAGAIGELGRSRGQTRFSILLAAFSALLARLTGETDVMVGAPVAGRPRTELEPLIGFFVNTLVLRCDLSGAPGFEELAERVAATSVAAQAHAELPFESLVQALHPQRSLSYSPLFQVVFAQQDAPGGRGLELPGLRLLPMAAHLGTSRFELALNWIGDGDLLGAAVTYKTGLFDRTTILRLWRSYEALLRAALAEPRRPVTELPLLGAGERHQLAFEHNDPRPDYLAGLPVHERFVALAALQPDAVAMVFDDGALAVEAITYGELARRVGAVAAALRRRGVGRESVVGVLLHRSPRVAVALLGILRAGGAYLPLDPDYPAQRLELLAADGLASAGGGPRWVLTEEALAGAVPEGCSPLRVEALAGETVAEPAEAPAQVVAGQAAYVLYTSGSTGRPKAVVISHGALANRLEWTARADASVPYRYLFKTTIGFDVSLSELFQPLAAVGGTVVGARRGGQLDLAYLLRLIARQRVTHAAFPPSVHAVLADQPALADCRSLRVLFTAGEAVSGDWVGRLQSRTEARLVNRYGPTEATIGVLSWDCAEGSGGGRVPVGRPIARATAYLLDGAGSLVAQGAPGELVLGGPGLARGYLRRPARTAASFVPDGVSGRPGERLYRTGDLARRRGDGAIEFLGRLDHQVKVRGFRVELGEIEAALAAHPAVGAAVVLDRLDGSGVVRLVAYCSPTAGQSLPSLEPAALAAHLAERLPAYMVPALFVPLAELPRTTSQKIDRSRLPEPRFGSAGESESRPAPRPPRGPVEGKIAAIWRDLLELEAVGTGDNFFDLGGHSLLLTRLQSRLREAFRIEIPMVELFRYPTVAEQAERVRRQAPAAPSVDRGVARALSRQEHGEIGNRDVAVIAYTGRFPGSKDPDQLWEHLAAGVAPMHELSDGELTALGVPAEVMNDPRYVRRRGFVEDFDRFDADLFGFSPRDAEITDPQQRLFMECAWEALELAGYDPGQWPGSVGVFAGVAASRYWVQLMLNPAVTAEVGRLQISQGNEKDFLPTRVSYKLNLNGPSVNVNTACSTSLVAVHLAAQSLLDGHCDMALAGGVTISTTDRAGYLWREGGITSADGHTRAFDAAATGTGSGEGCALVVLKRLADALVDGDPIRAVIRGSAVNNDGSDKIGFTAPSIDGQARVIAEAQAVAGVEPSSFGYVEAHGTATRLGDPIELAALKQVFGQGERGSVAIGSIKSNIGHTDTAAGACGLIKTVMALEHRQIPPSLDFTAPNPELGIEDSPFYVNTRLREWRPRAGAPRRAGVSAFGLGGTNAHVVVDEAPPAEPSGPSRTSQLLVLSAATPEALEMVTDRLARHLEAHPEVSLADVAHTLRVGRKPLAHRRVLVCGKAEGGEAEGSEGQGGRAARWLADRAPTRLLGGGPVTTSPPVAFLLPGVGDHYPAMGRELYASEPAFRSAIDRCAELLKPHLDVDLRELLYPAAEAETEADAPREPGQGNCSKPDLRSLLGRDGKGAGSAGAGRSAAARRLDRTRYAQPAVFAVEYALAQVWKEWGVEPEALIGYSLGEYTAATLAGVLELEDALALVAARAALIDELPEGVLLAVPLSEAEVLPLLAEAASAGGAGSPGLAVAVTNGPAVTIVGGREVAVAALEALLQARDLVSRRLHATHAFHTPMMEPIRERFLKRVRAVRLQPPTRRYLSNVTGTWIRPEEATDPSYWARHLCETLRFSEGVAALLEEGEQILIEVGPGQALSTAVLQHAARAAGHTIFPSLPDARARASSQSFLLTALGRLWLAGGRFDGYALVAHERRRRVTLPTYPFERRRYWLDFDASLLAGAGAGGPERRIEELADWFSLPSWKPSELPAAVEPGGAEDPAGRICLLFLDEAGLGDQLADRLAAAGRTVIRVRAGERRLEEPEGFTLPPADADGYDWLLDRLRASGRLPGRIVHLWGVSAESEGKTEIAASLAQSEWLTELCFYSVLHLAQALGNQMVAHPVGLMMVTTGGHEVTGGEPLTPEKALVTGPCRTLSQEYETLRGRHVDLVLADCVGPRAEATVRALAEELDAPAPEPVVAYRRGRRWALVHEPVRFEPRPDREVPFKRGGCYLITGGLGGLGLTFARELAPLGAKLILTGRRELPPREEWQALLAAQSANGNGDRSPGGAAETSGVGMAKARAVLELEAAGAEVMTAAVDVADVEGMARMMADARARFGGLDGVIHCAGLPAEGLTQLKGRTQAAAVLAPKVLGTRVLDALLADEELDFFALCSSVTAILGGLGQIDYCAANAFLDAFAHDRMARTGQLTVALDWGNWREVGMGLTAKVASQHEAEHREDLRLGIRPAEGVEALRRVLQRRQPQVVVSARDFAAAVARFRRLAVSGVLRGLEARRAALAAHPRPRLATAFVAPRDELERQVAELWQGLLGIDPIGIHDTFFELGGDSLLATQLLSRLRLEFQVQVPLEALFDTPTIEGLSGRLRGGEIATDLSEVDDLFSAIESMSDSEIAAALATGEVEEA